MSSPAGSTPHVEVERKFDVDDAAAPPCFDGILAAAAPVSQALDAVYFDTAARDLAAARITLRRRTGGADAGWHLKLPAGPGVRTEHRMPLGGDTVPAELRDLVLALVRDRPLSPVARIATARDVTLLSGADGVVRAEFCDDRVSAGDQRWREWEIELVADEPDLLERLGDRLRAAGAAPAAHGSKLARALGAAVPAGPVHHDRAHRAVAQLVDELLVWDRAVRVDADDAVHQMRVSIRKIRSLARGAAVADELRWLAGLLGVARDAEVLAERYRAALDRLPAQLVRGPVAHRLVAGAAARYQAGRAEALTAMRSKRYFRLLDGLDVLVAGPPATGAGPDRVDAAYRRVRKAARTAARSGHDADLHRIRKAAKRLRYIAAATEAPLIAERAKAIQSLLGDHQDSVVSRAHLLAEADAAHAAGADTLSYGLLYQQEADLAGRCRAQLDDALARLAESMADGRCGG